MKTEETKYNDVVISCELREMREILIKLNNSFNEFQKTNLNQIIEDLPELIHLCACRFDSDKQYYFGIQGIKEFIQERLEKHYQKHCLELSNEQLCKHIERYGEFYKALTRRAYSYRRLFKWIAFDPATGYSVKPNFEPWLKEQHRIRKS